MYAPNTHSIASAEDLLRAELMKGTAVPMASCARGRLAQHSAPHEMSLAEWPVTPLEERSSK